ncbi:MAG: L-2-amino-thiazoline-4-carboxylic acid hydrolase [Eubacteriales bacterium]|nr:L-2-amino-thiazoline-4-carboxylic acid hydrolase [Eubacteriales bacterium]
MSNIKNDPICKEAYVQKVRSAMQHRAQWLYLILDEAKKRGGDWEEVAREATSRCGCFQGAGLNEDWADHDSLKSFADVFADEDFMKYFDMEIVESTEDHLRIKFHHCPLVAGWQAIGCSDEEIAKLCDIAMDGDRNIANACNLNFTLGETIAEGGSCCDLTFRFNK